MGWGCAYGSWGGGGGASWWEGEEGVVVEEGDDRGEAAEENWPDEKDGGMMGGKVGMGALEAFAAATAASWASMRW